MPVWSLDVLEPVEIGGAAFTRHVLAGHADERTRKVWQTRRCGFVGEDARVELLRNPGPISAGGVNASVCGWSGSADMTRTCLPVRSSLEMYR